MYIAINAMQQKSCKKCNIEFAIEAEDQAFYDRIQVPAPTLCPQCRLIRRLVRRNERSFHRRTCEKCGKQMISVFAEASGIHVYCQACWWSDSWDGLEYGVDYDPSRPFFEQLDELFHRVPIMTLYGLYSTLVNSDYTNMVGWLKNCYMVTYSDVGENLVHGSFVNYSKDSVDNLMGLNLELCYETINCYQCYKTFFSVDCDACNEVWYSKNCSGCTNCYGCVNLRNKSYCIFNEQYTKEEYEKKIQSVTQEEAERFWAQYPQKFTHALRYVNSTGDYLNDTKNAKNCFVGFHIEDAKYCAWVTGKLTDAYDFTNFGKDSTLLYEGLQIGDQASQIYFSWWIITNVRDIQYSLFCDASSNLFGCVGMKHHEYSILNKQYSKEEYEALRSQIIANMKRDGEYGEFFPAATSPFGYNETSAQELFPLTKEQALAQGFNWRDPEKRTYEIGGDVLGCEHKGECEHGCSTAYRIHSYERQFLERFNLPTPTLCPQCRHHRRIKYRNPMQLWNRNCAKCNAVLETSYSPDRPEVIYCESCYQQEIL